MDILSNIFCAILDYYLQPQRMYKKQTIIRKNLRAPALRTKSKLKIYDVNVAGDHVIRHWTQRDLNETSRTSTKKLIAPKSPLLPHIFPSLFF